MLHRTYREAQCYLSLELPTTWGAFEQIRLGGEWIYRRISHHKKCKQCAKPPGNWTGKRTCHCGNPNINKGAFDGFGSLGAKMQHIKKYR